MAGYTTNLPDMNTAMEKKAVAAANGVKVARAAGEAAIDTLSHVAMRCGGCGSKVGAHVLSRVMKRLRDGGHIPTRKEVLIGLDAPDDAAVVQGIGVEMASVHTVDFFRSFITDPYIFGRIAANHALSDCHAMCADAVTALAIATVPFAVEEKVEGMLYQMMAGACETLRESGYVFIIICFFFSFFCIISLHFSLLLLPLLLIFFFTHSLSSILLFFLYSFFST